MRQLKRFLVIITAVTLLFLPVFSQQIIVNHLCTELSSIPSQWIDSAKSKLHIGYGHTSHGSQLVTGMNALLEYHGDLYDFNSTGANGALDLEEGAEYGTGWLELDCGYYPTWINETREYLNSTLHSDVNVIIWSWCGQAAGYSEQTMIDRYLAPMTQLENDYPDITFVYMTCHLNGTGADGTLNLRNEQIRNYCMAHDKVLFDFADIESYDPDGSVNYMELMADDYCDYLSGGVSRNWAESWIDANPNSELAQEADVCGSCAHSLALNCVLKGRALWWLWAKLAGWSGTAGNGRLSNIPSVITVYQNYPNPFNPSTTIRFTLSQDSRVIIKVYNVLGVEVATLLDDNRGTGVVHEIQFDASGLSSGVYFCRIIAQNSHQIKKFVLVN